jgi:hypothetical protein
MKEIISKVIREQTRMPVPGDMKVSTYLGPRGTPVIAAANEGLPGLMKITLEEKWYG